MSRRSDHEIDSIFIDRWSPRAFTGEAIPAAILARCFEAARWAPSGYNLQPWRFLYALRDGVAWLDFVALLGERNASWAANAAALVLILSDTVTEKDGATQPAVSHSFDAGAAWSNFAHQAHLLG